MLPDSTSRIDATSKTIEDVERGAELSFSGPLRGPCIIVKFYFQTTKFCLVFWFQTGQTDRRNKYVVGLPCSELTTGSC